MGLGLGTSLSKGGLATPSIVTDSLVLKHNYAAGGVTPVSDGAAFFDGTDDYITISDDNTLDFTTDFSIACWVKLNAINSTADGIVTKVDGDGVGYGIYADNADSKIKLFSTQHQTATADTGALSTGTWYHIAATHESGSVDENKIYVDGVLIDTTSATASLVANGEPLEFGRIFQDNGYNLNGYLCNVGLWSAVLTQAQVKSIMWKNYAGLTSSETTNLVSWWNLSANANDDHGSNNGTLT